MRSLQGVLTASELEIVNTSVSLRFKDRNKFKTPEALVVYEQRLLDDETLLRLCSEEYRFPLEIPKMSYVPKELLSHFSGYNCIPIRMDPIEEVIHIGVIKELESFRIPQYKQYRIEAHYVPIYFYVEQYTKLYNAVDFLLPLPPKDLFTFIVEEAVNLGASDITISNTENAAQIYYNVKKSKVHGKRVISKEDVKHIAELIGIEAGSPLIDGSFKPKYAGVRLDTHHRGRVLINKTYHGQAISIRVLPDETMDTTLEELNHSERTINFLRDVFLNKENGMRVMVGPTYSGKNTTVLSTLLEVIEEDNDKVVSVESPVELIVEGMEQINAETEEDFQLNVDSLIRMNPDIVYITEMTKMTSNGVMETANTGKRVFTSIHSNSLADVIPRIQDLTQLSLERILLNLHSAVYQNLERTKDGELLPVTRCIHFDHELKARLIGKDLGQIYLIIREEESKWS